MFDEFRGLPLHALVVHATVVLLPVTALLGVMYAVPRLRARLRWPLLAATVASLVTVYVTRQSGQALKESLNLGGPVAEAVERHQEMADQLVWLTVALTVVVAIATLVDISATRRGAADRRARASPQGGQAALQTVLAVLVLLASVAVGVQTVRVGEAGTRAVWNPTGDASFSGG